MHTWVKYSDLATALPVNEGLKCSPPWTPCVSAVKLNAIPRAVMIVVVFLIAKFRML